MTLNDLTLDTTQSIDVKADIGDVFRSLLHERPSIAIKTLQVLAGRLRKASKSPTA
jgi:hypothetical protein